MQEGIRTGTRPLHSGKQLKTVGSGVSPRPDPQTQPTSGQEQSESLRHPRSPCDRNVRPSPSTARPAAPRSAPHLGCAAACTSPSTSTSASSASMTAPDPAVLTRSREMPRAGGGALVLRAPLGRRGFRGKGAGGQTQEFCCETLVHPQTFLRCFRPVPWTLGCLTISRVTWDYSQQVSFHSD